MDIEEKNSEITDLLKKQVRIQKWTLAGVWIVAAFFLVATLWFLWVTVGVYVFGYGFEPVIEK